MITSSDNEYKLTKRIKQGKDRLTPPFDELAAWIAAKWDVAVLNVIYDRASDLHASPRLQVILEHGCDAKKFYQAPFSFDSDKQQAIAQRFIEMVNRQPLHKYDTKGMFVVFSAFAPLAREESDSRLSDEQIDALKLRLANPDLWVISRCFGNVTFMFYTDAQVATHAAAGLKKVYARKYFEILKPNDEFGYLTEDEFTVDFDSKQNFDANFESNWYYYYK